jgi:hypothetical protein
MKQLKQEIETITSSKTTKHTVRQNNGQPQPRRTAREQCVPYY